MLKQACARFGATACRALTLGMSVCRNMHITLHRPRFDMKTQQKLETIMRHENARFLKRRGQYWELPGITRESQRAFRERRGVRRLMFAELEYIRFRQAKSKSKKRNME